MQITQGRERRLESKEMTKKQLEFSRNHRHLSLEQWVRVQQPPQLQNPAGPPGVRDKSHGFLVGGCTSGSVTGNTPNSDVANLPRGIRPPARIRLTTGASKGDTKYLYALDPNLVGERHRYEVFHARRHAMKKWTSVPSLCVLALSAR